jgi:hypothetical protein
MPHEIETIKVNFSKQLKSFCFTITKESQLTKYFRLSIVVDILSDLQPVLDILVLRHFEGENMENSNLGYIRDKITFKVEEMYGDINKNIRKLEQL